MAYKWGLNESFGLLTTSSVFPGNGRFRFLGNVCLAVFSPKSTAMLVFKGASWMTDAQTDATPKNQWLGTLKAPIVERKIIFQNHHLGVSENNGIPKSSILIGFSIISHPFWGTPIFGNTHIHEDKYKKMLTVFTGSTHVFVLRLGMRRFHAEAVWTASAQWHWTKQKLHTELSQDERAWPIKQLYF